MEKIYVRKVNEVYIKVVGEPHIERELSDFFTFEVPSAKFMKSFRRRGWDGTIRIYSLRTKLIYSGLLEHLKIFCKERDIEIIYETEFNNVEFSEDEAKKFIELIKPTRTPRDYQLNGFIKCVRNRRGLVLSPTGSGKSLLIYLLTRLYTFKKSDRKFLIIVPTVSLVHQLASDFVDYGFSNDLIHRITAGESKTTDRPIIITCWQSIYKLDKSWFKQFKGVVVDEAHTVKAKSITDIMTKLSDCKYRFGFTGTLDGMECNKLVIEGLTGPIIKTATTKELIDRKVLANLNIKILLLKYDTELRKSLKNITYQEEMDFLAQNKDRNKFIKNLALSLKGNTLILYQFVEKHGKLLYDEISKQKENCYFIHGGVSGEDREALRHLIDSTTDNTTIASYGTFQVGVNIVHLDNIIAASPSKSKIRVFQSIGRGLRVSEKKTSVTWYDIADDLSLPDHRNYTLNHLFERVTYYDAERLTSRIYPIELRKQPVLGS